MPVDRISISVAPIKFKCRSLIRGFLHISRRTLSAAPTLKMPPPLRAKGAGGEKAKAAPESSVCSLSRRPRARSALAWLRHPGKPGRQDPDKSRPAGKPAGRSAGRVCALSWEAYQLLERPREWSGWGVGPPLKVARAGAVRPRVALMLNYPGPPLSIA